MKVLKKVLLIIMCVVILSGCSSKRETVDKNTFIRAAKNNGYAINSVKDSYDYASNAFVYTGMNAEFTYIEGTEEAIISNLYYDEVKNALYQAGEEAKTKTSKGSNYSSYSAENDDYFYYVCLVDKNYITVKVSQDNKENMIKFLTEIGMY